MYPGPGRPRRRIRLAPIHPSCPRPAIHPRLSPVCHPACQRSGSGSGRRLFSSKLSVWAAHPHHEVKRQGNPIPVQLAVSYRFQAPAPRATVSIFSSSLSPPPPPPLLLPSPSAQSSIVYLLTCDNLNTPAAQAATQSDGPPSSPVKHPSALPRNNRPPCPSRGCPSSSASVPPAASATTSTAPAATQRPPRTSLRVRDPSHPLGINHARLRARILAETSRWM